MKLTPHINKAAALRQRLEIEEATLHEVTSRTFTTFRDSSGYINVTLMDNGRKAAGYVWAPNSRTFGNLYVQPYARRNGLARVLVEDCKVRFGSPVYLFAQPFDLSGVTPPLSAMNLMRFYSSLGFNPCPERGPDWMVFKR